MKKRVFVEQKHLYTNEKNCLFNGYAEIMKIDDQLIVSYTEQGHSAKVSITADFHTLVLQRIGEITSKLEFTQDKKTVGKLMSEFGTIELDIYTYKYIRKENSLMLTYDIISQGEVTDGYEIHLTIKEDQV